MTPKLIIPLLSAASLLLAGIKTGYDRLADFSQYKTYSWIAAAPAGDSWADRIVHDVDAQLEQKGWRKIQSGGDMVLSAFGRTHDGQTVQGYYTGIDGGWKWHGLEDTAKADETEVGTLLVDVFDGKSKKLIWRGSSTETLSAKPDTDRLEQDITYLFRDFPKMTN
jgi:hypothetical protein